MQLELTERPDDVLDAAGGYLAADPVVASVVATVTARAAAADARGDAPPAHPRWWVVVRDEAGEVVGVAMRTAPFAPHPVYVLPMPDEAAVAVARALHDRGEPVGGVNGALPAAEVLAGELARLRGGAVRVHERTRLWEAAGVVPHAAPGRLRRAGPDDVDLVAAWWNDFPRQAAAQAGRDPGAGHGEVLTTADLESRVAAGLVHLWEDGGRPVHLTAHQAPAYGVVRVGPVLTPPEHRRRGYASAAVATVTQRALDAGHRACLFTDQANPTSNRIYEAVGYRPVVDMVNLLLTGPGAGSVTR